MKAILDSRTLNVLRKHWEKFIGFLLALSLVGPYGFTDDYAAIGATKDLIEMVKGGIAESIAHKFAI